MSKDRKKTEDALPPGSPCDVHVRVRYYVLALLLAPLLVLWRQDNVIFTAIGQIDPWLYFGYFRNLVEFKRSLPDAPYYGSRLSWLIPGHLVHSLLPPVTASVALHLSVHSIASLSLFSVLRYTAGARAAFLGAMFFSLHPWLWAATGWDYVDGPGIAYTLAAMALLTRAALPGGSRWTLFAAGAALAGMVYANLFLAAFVPPVAATYVTLAWYWRRQPVLRAATVLVLAAGAGAAALTLLLGCFNQWLDGNFWFYRTSFRAASTLMNHNPYLRGIWLPEGLFPHLWFPLLATLAASLGCISRVRVPALLICAQMLYSAAVMGCAQFLGGNPVLALSYYSSFLMPFSFLVLAAIFWGAADGLPVRSFVVLATSASLGFAILWADPLGSLLPLWPSAIRPTLILAGAAAAAWLIVRKRTAGICLSTAALFLLAAYVRPRLPADPHLARRNFERVIRLRNDIEAARRANPVVFWYDEKEPAALEYLALNSTYVLPPSPAFPAACPAAKVDTGALVVVTSNRDRPGQIAATKLRQCWSGLALIARPVLTEPGAGYAMALLRVEDDLSRWRPLQASFFEPDYGRLEPAPGPATGTPFPAMRWRPLDEGSDRPSAAPAPGGYLMTTCRQAGLRSFQYPRLAMPVDGQYRFTLRYQPVEGSFAFGALDTGSNDWVGLATAGRRVGDHLEMSLSARLKHGQTLRFVVMNNAGPSPARLLLRELTAVRIAEPEGE